MALRTVIHRIKAEIRELVPSALYFFVAFSFLGATKNIILQHQEMGLVILARASLGALLMAKVIFIMSLMKSMEPFSRTPIIYNVMWKSLWTVIFAILIQILEEIIPPLIQHHDPAPILQTFTALDFWFSQVWLVVLVTMFWMFKDLIRAIGPAVARGILLGNPRKKLPH